MHLYDPHLQNEQRLDCTCHFIEISDLVAIKNRVSVLDCGRTRCHACIIIVIGVLGVHRFCELTRDRPAQSLVDWDGSLVRRAAIAAAEVTKLIGDHGHAFGRWLPQGGLHLRFHRSHVTARSPLALASLGPRSREPIEATEPWPVLVHAASAQATVWHSALEEDTCWISVLLRRRQSLQDRFGLSLSDQFEGQGQKLGFRGIDRRAGAAFAAAGWAPKAGGAHRAVNLGVYSCKVGHY